MEIKNKPYIVSGTWSWGTGAVGDDQVFGNNLDVEELNPVFDEARILEDTAENTGVDTRGSWENPMI